MTSSRRHSSHSSQTSHDRADRDGRSGKNEVERAAATVRDVFRDAAAKSLATGGIAGVIGVPIAAAITDLSWPVHAALFVGMLAVGIVAMIPGATMPAAVERGPSSRSMALSVGYTAAALIRVVGVVALVGVASYYLPPYRADQTIALHRGAAITLAVWYAVLTTVEVFWLARGGRRIDVPFRAGPPTN